MSINTDNTPAVSKPDPQGSSGPQGQSSGTSRPRYILTQHRKPQKPPKRQKRPPRRKGYYGPPKCEVGTMFASRKECSDAGVHHPTMAGISCTNQNAKDDPDPGAFSIVLNGGYEDDQDLGDIIWYSGAGGQPGSYEQVAGQSDDQSIDHYFNYALRLNVSTGNPVRVIRGFKNPSEWAPREGYRYDGLYRVLEYKIIKGKSGHRVCHFKLKRLPNQRPLKELPTGLR